MSSTSRVSVTTSLVEVTDKLDSPPCRVYFKNELEQPSGSFKLRGIGSLIQHLLATKEPGKVTTHVYSSSGGNAGLAAAYASRELGVPCTVCLPKSSTKAVPRLEKLGAEVVIFGEHWGLADDHLRNVVIARAPRDVQAVYVHPFDHPVIWDGHADIVDEVKQQLGDEECAAVKAVVCSVGGGGLYNGIVGGLHRNGMDNARVLAVETTQTPTFSSAVAAGKVVTLPKVVSTTTSLASPYLSQQSFEYYGEGKTVVKMVDDAEATAAAKKHNNEFGRKVEAACGAALVAVFDRKDLLKDLNLKRDDIVVVVVCGGVIGIDA